MGKITRQQLKLHEQVEELLWGSDKKLNREQVAFCLEHWDPRALAGKDVAKNQAYFTPLPLAIDAGKYIGGDGRKVVDIGAGVGRLAYAVLCANWWDSRQVQITAVEINPEYVKAGRRLLPEVTWVEGDMYDLGLWQSLPRFDEAVSNPPFGQVLTDCDTGWIGYRSPAGLTVAAIGLKVTRLGITLILPQTQTPYRYSGRRPGENVCVSDHMGYLERFMTQRPDLEWHHSSIDTEHEVYKSGWRGASPVVELVSLRDPDAERIPLPSRPAVPRPVCSLALTG
jgi:SAM-dependent methyltransferase